MDYNILNEIRRCAGFNKSSLFLYPLLGLNKTITPLNTYMGFENYDIDCCLILLFHKTQPNYDKWINELTTNTFYDFTIQEDDYVYYVYCLDLLEQTFNHVKNGDYSKIDSNVKTILNIKGEPIVHIAINPELFYERLAQELQFPVESLRQNVEIITKPNLHEELIHINVDLLKEILE
jgi:hypothetical protein